MKSAVKTVPVFGTGGDYVIGEIECGGKTLVLGETQKGVVIAYMLGVVKPEHAHLLVDEDEWEQHVSEKDRLLCFAKGAIGSIEKDMFEHYLKKRSKIGEYKRVARNQIKAGDLVLDSSERCIGVYMGDGSVILEDNSGLIKRAEAARIGRAIYARPDHPDFMEDDVQYSRRLRKTRNGLAGDDVRAVQGTLCGLGFFTGKTGGMYTVKTKRAVRRFQKSKGLRADGSVDYATWKLLVGR